MSSKTSVVERHWSINCMEVSSKDVCLFILHHLQQSLKQSVIEAAACLHKLKPNEGYQFATAVLCVGFVIGSTFESTQFKSTNVSFCLRAALDNMLTHISEAFAAASKKYKPQCQIGLSQYWMLTKLHDAVSLDFFDNIDDDASAFFSF